MGRRHGCARDLAIAQMTRFAGGVGSKALRQDVHAGGGNVWFQDVTYPRATAAATDDAIGRTARLEGGHVNRQFRRPTGRRVPVHHSQAHAALDEDSGDGDLIPDGAWAHIEYSFTARGAVVNHHKRSASLFGKEDLQAEFARTSLNDRGHACERTGWPGAATIHVCWADNGRGRKRMREDRAWGQCRAK